MGSRGATGDGNVLEMDVGDDFRAMNVPNATEPHPSN
jgi:hypothetical protein